MHLLLLYCSAPLGYSLYLIISLNPTSFSHLLHHYLIYNQLLMVIKLELQVTLQPKRRKLAQSTNNNIL